ncbi:hypothetical protein IX317_001093 [Fusobacterium sp. DD29]|uniref:hypothetical protein n=1 Tax=unclassified Fusobacterium TaxID=2648384 RepID=UPI001B8D07E7|nr:MULTISPECIES: hypothetical protein [unclassified Fusobacterium]MBR8701292.1 hypothetical protein [Fusobacterium sp. DD45]MBR8711092.1 hypothetical protein [Fusobacterium sp. DD28]MBR8749419.1 hypothetical protein [Fusobacterium sp. DD29]MBR8751666.1 hypothetical protein [Fusobacterium sp. DD26]MBR8761691.1 hypothetical protein [Fusobacterium sp. DD25]
MKIQYISTRIEAEQTKKINENIFLFSKLSSPFSLDSFDINIIDFNYIWKNSNSENILKIDVINDIDSLKDMIQNSKNTKFIIFYPQNERYEYKTVKGMVWRDEKKLLKDMIPQVSEIISYLLKIDKEVKILYERTATVIDNNIVLMADFCFNEKKEVLTKSSSDKATTIKFNERVYLTTLNFERIFNKEFQESIIPFLKKIKLIEEKSTVPDWLETINFLNDKEEKEKIKENNKIINKAQEEIETSKKILDKNLYYKSILYATGDELVKVVFDILGDILDYNLNNFTDERKEDFLIKKENITFIGEIKGVNGSVKNANISQLDNHYNMYIDKLNDENKEENVKALLIINYNRNSPINERNEIHENQINLAERNKSLIIPTYDLLKLYEAFKQHRISSDEIEKMFIDKIGVFKYI